MPPVIAVLVTVLFCGFMLWRDGRRAPRASSALWLPVIWIFIIGSQFLGQWLDTLGITQFGAVRAEDGSPIDALFFSLLIFAGIAVLIRRGISLRSVVANNVWITVFLIYCLVAITWSDFPVVAAKRWVKILGHPIMALIILSDSDRVEAFRTVLRRCAYLHIPLSILFIKYLPQGRGFDGWTGAVSNRGINLNKNELGYACLVFGLFLFWDLFFAARRGSVSPAPIEKVSPDWSDRVTRGAFLAMCGWLLLKSDSATSLACTVLGASVMVLADSPFVTRKYLGTYVILAIGGIVIAEFTFGVYANTLGLLGRDSTLTDRTYLWADVLAMDINPVFGAGFESFWLGPRLEALWSKWWWQPNQAHNGYIETYLNLGYIGVAILLCMLLSTYRRSHIELLRQPSFGRFRLGVLAAVIAYNYTEATFKGLHLVWTAFYLVAMDYPQAGQADHGVDTENRRKLAVARRPLRWRRPQPARRPNIGSGGGGYPAVEKRRSRGR